MQISIRYFEESKNWCLSERNSSNGLKFFDEKSSGGVIKGEDITNQWLINVLHRPMIKRFEKTVSETFFNG